MKISEMNALQEKLYTDSVSDYRSDSWYAYHDREYSEFEDDKSRSLEALIDDLIEDGYIDYDEVTEKKRYQDDEDIIEELRKQINDSDILYKGGTR